MSSNRFDSGESSLEEERQFLDGLLDKEDFVKMLTGYLTAMQEK